MCKFGSLIYLTCICICILISTSSAFPKKPRKAIDDALQNLTDSAEALHKNKVKIVRKKLSLGQRKAQLTSKLNKAVAKLSGVEKARQSKLVAELLVKHSMYRPSTKIAVYINNEYEVQTTNIIKQIFKSKKICYVPKYADDGKITMVRLRSFRDVKKLLNNQLNTTYRTNDTLNADPIETGDLNLLIIPGVGFTEDGIRLGRGKRSYERYLNEYEKRHPFNYCVTIGLAYEEQMCKKIPTSSQDCVVDYVLWPSCKSYTQDSYDSIGSDEFLDSNEY